MSQIEEINSIISALNKDYASRQEALARLQQEYEDNEKALRLVLSQNASVTENKRLLELFESNKRLNAQRLSMQNQMASLALWMQFATFYLMLGYEKKLVHDEVLVEDLQEGLKELALRKETKEHHEMEEVIDSQVDISLRNAAEQLEDSSLRPTPASRWEMFALKKRLTPY